jgi:hypothetical protein
VSRGKQKLAFNGEKIFANPLFRLARARKSA